MIYTRQHIEKNEKKSLASYASFSSDSQGRIHKEKADAFRTCFQRDRDRIIHSKAFRRLKGKTQVFVAHHGDHFRSRLAHSMEVAQISRDMARTLGLNEDLAESIALAHDLGHTPFGHAGEEALSKKMEEYDEKFEHNKQSTRIVTEIEKRSERFDGLNLSHEVIEGLGKHDTPYDKPNAEAGALPSLEAQIVNLADEIAYINHDLDDGLRSGILQIKDLETLELWNQVVSEIPKIQDANTWISRCAGKLIHIMVSDIYEESSKRIKNESIQTLEDVQKSNKKIVAFSDNFYRKKEALRILLFQKFYKQPSVVTMNAKGQKIISDLFDFFTKHIKEIPEEYRIKREKKKHHLVRDYIAGMTDNFAEEIWRKFI